jgi:hypothetical protein
MKKFIASIICFATISTIANAAIPTVSQVDSCYFSDDTPSRYDRIFKGCDFEEEKTIDDEGIVHNRGECRVIYKAKSVFAKDQIGTYGLDIQVKRGDAPKYRVVIDGFTSLMMVPDNTCRYRRWNSVKESK